MRSFDCIERPLSLLFYRYGRFVSKNPWPFICMPVLLTIAMSTGFLFMEPITDAIYLFTPVNALSKMERQAVHDLWPLVNGSYIPGRALTVHAKNDGNILQKPYSESVTRLDMYIQTKVKVEYNNETYYYKDLCLGRHNQGCPGNKHIPIISDLFQHGFNITYPTVTFGGVYVFNQLLIFFLFRRGYIGSSLGGVSVSYKDDTNKTMILAGAKAWLMVYHLQFYPPNSSYISGLALEDYPEDDNIEFTYFHSQTLAEELKRNADSLVPRFVLAFTILMFFSVLCNMSFCDESFYIDWAVSKPILAVMGVINAGMGILSGIGALNLFGVPYNDIVGVMPFLVVAVGVDNMFLMVAAVRRTNRAYSVSRRIGEAMSDAAISMFITSLTDAFSFGVGAITTIPAVQIFCFYTCAAMVTFFHGLLALAIRWESEGKHCLIFKQTIDQIEADDCTFFERMFMLGTRADPDPKNLAVNLKESTAATFFQNWYGPILMQPAVRFLAVLWFIIYMAFAIYGCMQLREGLEPVNLLVQDSYAIPHYRALEHYFWHYGASLQIVVNNAPDLRMPGVRERLTEMAHAFANTNHSIGDDSIQFWLFEMERYYKDNTEDIYKYPQHFYELARNFFWAKNTDYWPEDVKWHEMPDGTLGIQSFRFLIGLRDISTSVDQQKTTALMRSVAAQYSDYNVTTFMPLWLFTDQYALVVPNTIQNIAIAMIVMIVIAILLIPQPTCALWVALAIASIDIGVIGYMTLWNDAISMITIIMSIGFSVDYSAHITYGYVISTEHLPSDRIRHALGALGWPLTQGAVSTILAVIVLADVPAYMIVTFFKTVFLAISLGLLHGLVFLPVTLSLFVRGSCIASAPAKKDFHEFDFTTLEMKQWKEKAKGMKHLEGQTNKAYTLG